jgi:DNA-binding NarL/FixJ family response regulator
MWDGIEHKVDVSVACETRKRQVGKRIRVLIADDHELVRYGLTALLSSYEDIEVVGEAANGRDAIDLCMTQQPDVVLMDLQMPVLSGFDSIARIRELLPSCRVLVVTTFGGDARISRALRAGAAGYLLKATLRSELVEAIRATYGGERKLAPEVAVTLANNFDCRELAPREVNVLQLVADGNSNKEIARRLGISEETVKGYMKFIFTKLEARDRAHAVTIAVKRGILNF